MPHTRTFVIRALIALAIAHGAAAQTAPTTAISPSPILQFWDSNGKPLAGGQVCVYAAGTTTPVTLYKDAAGMVPWGNPITLDSTGRAIAYVPVTAIKYVLRVKGSPNNCSSGSTLYTIDNVQDTGLRLRSDLAGVNGGGNIGMQQPGGIPITVQDALTLCPDARQYASLAAAIANVPAGGCLICSSSLTGPVTITAAISFHAQPGCKIAATSNVSAITIRGATGVLLDGTGTVDGRYSQSAFSDNAVTISGSDTVTVDGWSVINGGGFGILLDGSMTGNSHVKIMNGNFSASRLDAIYSQGPMDGLELARNRADCSAAAVNISHCFGVHASYGAGYGTVQNINIHDNNELCPQGNFCNEIGSFFDKAGLPYPAASQPSKVFLAHNSCLNNAMASAGCDSLSVAASFDIDGDKFDENNALTVNAPFEFISANGAGRGLETSNCNAAQTLAVSVNAASNFALSDSTLCGAVVTGVSAPIYFQHNLSALRLHHNKITLMPSSAPATGGCFQFQINDPGSTLSQVHIDHNDCSGVSTSDGAALVSVLTGPCSAAPTQFDISNNTVNSAQYGYNQQATGMCAPTSVNYVGNLLGPGVNQFGPAGPAGATYNNPGQLSNQPPGGGPVPGLTLIAAGAGTGATYHICDGAGTAFTGSATVADANCTLASTPYAGVVIVTAGTAAATANAVFQLAIPAFAFDRGPACQSTTFGSTSGATNITSITGNTATQFTFNNYTTALASGVQYAVAYYCPKN